MTDSAQVGRKLFDAHFHLGTWGTRELDGASVTPLGGGQPGRYSPGMEHRDAQDCLTYLDHYGIDRGVVMANYLASDPGYSLIDLNRLALDTARTSDRLYAALFVSPLESEWSFTKEALDWAGEPGVKAIKFTSTHWAPYTVDPATWDAGLRKRMERILEVAHEQNAVLHFHTGHLNSLPQEFDGFLAGFGRDFRVQLVHSGETVYSSMQFVPRFPRWVASGFDVYCDTSMCPGFVLPWLLREVSDDAAARSRILFATDSPWGTFPSEHAKVNGLDVPDEIKDAIFWDNSARLYGVVTEALAS